MTVNCPHCYKRYSLSDSLAGRTIRCRNCGGAMTLPAPKKVRGQAGSPNSLAQLAAAAGTVSTQPMAKPAIQLAGTRPPGRGHWVVAIVTMLLTGGVGAALFLVFGKPALQQQPRLPPKPPVIQNPPAPRPDFFGTNGANPGGPKPKPSASQTTSKPAPRPLPVAPSPPGPNGGSRLPEFFEGRGENSGDPKARARRSGSKPALTPPAPSDETPRVPGLFDEDDEAAVTSDAANEPVQDQPTENTSGSRLPDFLGVGPGPGVAAAAPASQPD